MKLTASLRVLSYLTVKAKNSQRLLMEKLGLEDVELENGGKVLDFWEIDDIKNAITNSAGLLYFMDGTTGEIESPTQKGLQATDEIIYTLIEQSNKLLNKKINKDDIDIESGVLTVDNKEIKLGKFINKLISAVNKRVKDDWETLKRSDVRELEYVVNTSQGAFENVKALDKDHGKNLKESAGGIAGTIRADFMIDATMNYTRHYGGSFFIRGTDGKIYNADVTMQGVYQTITNAIEFFPADLSLYFGSVSLGDWIDPDVLINKLKALLDKFSLAKPAKFRYKITADPGDVLRMSCGQTWGSCMSPGGAASQGPITDVLAGSAAMFFYQYNDKDYRTPVGRNILRPATDEWEPIIVVAPVTYGNGPLPNRILEEIKKKFPDIHSEISGPNIRPAMITNGIYDDHSRSTIEQSQDEMEDARKSLVDIFGKAGLIKEDKFQDVKELAEDTKKTVSPDDIIRKVEYFITRGMYAAAGDVFTDNLSSGARDAFERFLVSVTEKYYKDIKKEDYSLGHMDYTDVFDNYTRSQSEQIGEYIFQKRELRDKLYEIIDGYSENDEEEEPKEKSYIEKKVDEFEAMRDAVENNAAVPNWNLIFDRDRNLATRFDERFREELHKEYPGIDQKAMYKPMSWVVEHYSAYVIEIMDKFMDDKEELEAFISNNGLPDVTRRRGSKRAMRITSSLRILSYQTLKAKNESRLLLDKLGLDEDVLEHWSIDELKKVIENSAGLLYFMDGTTGTIKGPPANTNADAETIQHAIHDYCEYFKEERPEQILASDGFVIIDGRKVRLGKYLTQKIEKINKKNSGLEQALHSPSEGKEVKVAFSPDMSMARIKQFDEYGTAKLEDREGGGYIGTIQVNNLPELDAFYDTVVKPLYVVGLNDQTIAMLVWNGGSVTDILLMPERTSERWVDDELIIKKRLELALRDFSLLKDQNFRYKVTADPGEVLRMSCGRTWESCMSPGGVASEGPLTDVYAGHAIIYFYVQDDKDQKTPIGRNIIRAGVNGPNPVIIISPSTKGNGPQPEDIAMEIRKKFPDIKVIVGGFQDVEYSIMRNVYDDSIRGTPNQSSKDEQRSKDALTEVFERNNLIKPSTNVKFSELRDISQSTGSPTGKRKELYKERTIAYMKELTDIKSDKAPKFDKVFKDEKIREEFYNYVVRDSAEALRAHGMDSKADRLVKMSYTQAYRENPAQIITTLKRILNYGDSELIKKDVEKELEKSSEKKASIKLKAEDLRDFLKNHKQEFITKYTNRYKDSEEFSYPYKNWLKGRENERFETELDILESEIKKETNAWDEAFYGSVGNWETFVKMVVYAMKKNGNEAVDVYLKDNPLVSIKDLDKFINTFPKECARAAKGLRVTHYAEINDLVAKDAREAAQRYDPNIEEWIAGNPRSGEHGAGEAGYTLEDSIDTFVNDFEHEHIKDGKIKVYRGIKLNKRWLEDIESTQFYDGAPLGVYWTVDEDVAEKFISLKDADQIGLIFVAMVDENQVDWNKTLEYNLSPSFGEAFIKGSDPEKEVRLIKGTSIKLDDVLVKENIEIPEEIFERTFKA